MNSIIGQRRNQQQNKKNQKIELTFVVVLCLADRKDYHYELKSYTFHVKIWRVGRIIVHNVDTQFPDFFQFSKNRQ